MIRHIVRFACLLASLEAASVTASSPSTMSTIELTGFPQIETYTLANGLEVFLWPDTSTNLVAGNVWYRSGGLHERPGVTGIAHLFEHLMFRPSKYAPTGVLETVSNWAAEAGATTKYKTTNFEVNLSGEKIEDYLRLEADRMVNLPVDAEILLKEKEAVRSEYLNWDNTAMMVLLPVLAKNLFPGHAAGSFVTGERADLDKITAQNCIDFYRSSYAPNNAALVLTGNFKPQQVKSWINKYFAPIPRGTPKTPPSDPVDWPKAKLVSQDVPGDSHFLVVGFPIPFYRASEPGLYLALETLFKGKDSLVGRELMLERKVAAEVTLDVNGLGWPIVVVVLNRGEDVQSALDGIDAAVKKAPETLTAERLRRYAVDYQATLLRALQSPSQRAFTLGSYLNYKDGTEGLKRDLNAARELSTKDVSSAISKYINPEHRVAVYGKPKG